MKFTQSFVRVVLLLVSLTAVSLIASVMFVVVFATKPDFDRAHPDYESFSERFAQARQAFTNGEDWVVIDLAPINRGAWRSACLFGGFTHPIEEMDRLGGIVSGQDRDRLAGAIGFRAAPVEEYELLIAYIDETGLAHFIHFERGVGPEGQHFEACVTKPKTKVAIASWNREQPGLPTSTD